MIFAENIPPLDVFPNGFPGFWLGSVFIGYANDSYEGRALLSNYVRHVEAAFRHYRRGRAEALQFIQRDASHLPIYEFMNASTDFEECIDHVYRAMQCMQGIIRSQSVPQPLRDLFSSKPAFVARANMTMVSDLRDSAQHTYDKIRRGKLQAGGPFVLAMDGREEPISDPSNPNQILKTWDRLSIGTYSITFDQVVEWLTEMGNCAERITSYSSNSHEKVLPRGQGC